MPKYSTIQQLFLKLGNDSGELLATSIAIWEQLLRWVGIGIKPFTLVDALHYSTDYTVCVWSLFWFKNLCLLDKESYRFVPSTSSVMVRTVFDVS